jgi:deoxyribose-phosphate aldolase
MASAERNPGMPLDLAWVASAKVNLPALLRRVETFKNKRSVKMDWQAAWYLRAVSCTDLTTLSGDDTESNVARLCMKAKHPIRQDLIKALGMEDRGITVGAVCVYPSRVAEAVKFLEGTGIPVASVAAGFPAGQTPLELRLREIEYAVGQGAKEIDIVISRAHVLNADWQALYDETVAMRAACGDSKLKSILAIGELGSMDNVLKASLVCMMAGSDTIKTSTGKEGVNATFEVAFVMVRAIRDYFERTGYKVGFKPAGGIRSAKDTLIWLALMKDELGDEWTHPKLFRLGASALVTDIERQLFHHTTGRYAAGYQMPLS